MNKVTKRAHAHKRIHEKKKKKKNARKKKVAPGHRSGLQLY